MQRMHAEPRELGPEMVSGMHAPHALRGPTYVRGGARTHIRNVSVRGGRCPHTASGARRQCEAVRGGARWCVAGPE